MVLVGHLGIPALAGDSRHSDIHSAPVAFTFAPEAASGDIVGPWLFLCLRDQKVAGLGWHQGPLIPVAW